MSTHSNMHETHTLAVSRILVCTHSDPNVNTDMFGKHWVITNSGGAEEASSRERPSYTGDALSVS